MVLAMKDEVLEAVAASPEWTAVRLCVPAVSNTCKELGLEVTGIVLTTVAPAINETGPPAPEGADRPAEIRTAWPVEAEPVPRLSVVVGER